MATKLCSPIKAQILTNLQALVTSGDLGSVREIELTADPFAGTYPAFPVAILGTSDMAAAYEDEYNNARTYSFPILVIARQDDTNNNSAVEDVRDAIANTFDTDFDLGGTAIGAAEAAFSPTATASDDDKTFIFFIVTIKAKTLYTRGN